MDNFSFLRDLGLTSSFSTTMYTPPSFSLNIAPANEVAPLINAPPGPEFGRLSYLRDLAVTSSFSTTMYTPPSFIERANEVAPPTGFEFDRSSLMRDLGFSNIEQNQRRQPVDLDETLHMHLDTPENDKNEERGQCSAKVPRQCRDERARRLVVLVDTNVLIHSLDLMKALLDQALEAQISWLDHLEEERFV